MATETINSDLIVKALPRVTDHLSDEEKMAIGRAFINEGKYLHALEFFSVLTDKGNQDARKHLAYCHFNLENYTVAHYHFQHIADNAEGELKDYCKLAIALIEATNGNTEKAITMLKSLPQNPVNQFNLSTMYWKNGTINGNSQSIRDSFETMKLIDTNTFCNSQLSQFFQLKPFFINQKRIPN